jgi:hypothetical protein
MMKTKIALLIIFAVVLLNGTIASTAYKAPAEVAHIIAQDPQLVLGYSELFEYDAAQQCITLSRPFQQLLELLVKLEELDSKALTADSLYDLNAVLQQPQQRHGGFLRPKNLERWDLKDNPHICTQSAAIKQLLQQLGFISPKPLTEHVTADACLIFGGSATCMARRIAETLEHLARAETFFLLGSNRSLKADELEFLQAKLEKLEEPFKSYWKTVFQDPEQSTEAAALTFLWQRHIPAAWQASVLIQSTAVGHAFPGGYGYRPTTEVTLEDWLQFYRPDRPQALFALVEQPFSRLLDQLRLTLLSNGKKADRNELFNRIQNCTFYFVLTDSDPKIPLCLILDEIARNVFRTIETLVYLESLVKNAMEPRPSEADRKPSSQSDFESIC